MSKKQLYYGSYKIDEIDIITELYKKNNVEYERSMHYTSKGYPFYTISGQCTLEEQNSIRSELASITRRKWNWGRMNFN